jgi:hypothetical protein
LRRAVQNEQGDDMATRLVSVVVDANDLVGASRWWASALGWRVVFEADDEVAIEPPEGSPGLDLVFVLVPEPKRAKNRIHLDLASRSEADQVALVDRLVEAGARRLTWPPVPWVVLADPEGNELCVLEPRAGERDTGALASVVVDVVDPRRQATFWADAAGWTVVEAGATGSRLRSPSGTGPFLDLVPVPEPKQVKNRLHLDVAPFAGEDQGAAVHHLEEAGATRADVGQGPGVSWVVLADPEGQEFCVLSPR